MALITDNRFKFFGLSDKIEFTEEEYNALLIQYSEIDEAWNYVNNISKLKVRKTYIIKRISRSEDICERYSNKYNYLKDKISLIIQYINNIDEDSSNDKKAFKLLAETVLFLFEDFKKDFKTFYNSELVELNDLKINISTLQQEYQNNYDLLKSICDSWGVDIDSIITKL